MIDRGLTHIALPVRDLEASIAFYVKYAGMHVVHRRASKERGSRVAWISDRTRPFVVVLIEMPTVDTVLSPIAHLGVGCANRAEIDRLAEQARREGCLHSGPTDSGHPVGYWAFLRDPDGHTLEVAFGQEVALVVGDADSADAAGAEHRPAPAPPP